MDKTIDARLVNATPRYRWLALLTLCLAVLIAQVDTAVVNLAVHPIGEYFGASVGARRL
jgi:hypothetical protein